jgi:hypothetical protein
MKKNRLNRLEYLKNQPVRFWFHKFETEKPKRTEINKKTEPNQKKNRVKPKPNPLEIKKKNPENNIVFCF